MAPDIEPTWANHPFLFAVELLSALTYGGCAIVIFWRMLGITKGSWLDPTKVLRMWSEHWRIAPDRGWWRYVPVTGIISFIVALTALLLAQR